MERAEPPTGYSDCEDTVDTIFREMQKYATVVLIIVLTLSAFEGVVSDCFVLMIAKQMVMEMAYLIVQIQMV